MLNPQTTVKLMFIVVFGVIAYLAMTRTRSGSTIPIRRLPAIDAMDEATGRATEVGRPFMVILYCADARMDDQLIASLDLVRYAATSAARYEAPFVVVTNSADGFPIAQDIVKGVYTAEGKPDKFGAHTVRFIGGYGSMAETATMSLMEELNIAADLITGNLMFSTLMFAEQGAKLGAIQIGATRMVYQLPFIAASCDYSLMGEELYAASTYIARDPVRVGYLTAQEFGKLFALGAIAIGVILTTMGSTSLTTLLGK